jgi:hypothetical protein
MAFHLRWNHWNGSRSLQAVVVGTQPTPSAAMTA